MSAINNFLKQHKTTHVYTSCQWPYGDPQEKDFYFCGNIPVENKPYCETHCNIAYVDEKELKKEKQVLRHRRIAA